MATTAAHFLSSDFSPSFRRHYKSVPRKPTRNLVLKRVSAVPSEEAIATATTARTTPFTSVVEKKTKSGEEAETRWRVNLVEESEKEECERQGNGKSLKDYFDEARDLAMRSDGGPPRWFSPLESGSHSPDSPLLLYLPGIDGVGLGLIRQHQTLGKIFDIWCLHIPVKDRTSFTGLVKLIERCVKSENYRSPNRPIYLVGENLGACLALAVAARNPDIDDLVLILANPATSFSKSVLQPTVALLELMPGEVTLSLSFMLGLMTGDPLKRAMDNVVNGLSRQLTVEKLSQDLAAIASYLPVLADILPKETVIWKLELLKSASAYANARLHAVKAPTLILCSGKDQFLPSKEEGQRLRRALPKCEIRRFEDNGLFLFLEDGIDLVTIIKGASFYRRGKILDYVSDYIPPTTTEFRKIYEESRWISTVTSPVMLSTLEDGKIVKGLSGIPSQGPVLFVGYHMLLGLELLPMVPQFIIERNILLRGIAHPMMFFKSREGRLPDLGQFDILRLMGAVPVSATNFYKLLSSKSHVLLYPGGMREALHRKGEEYKLFWPEDKSEFVRMAARFGAKIVPFGAVGEDDIAQLVLDYNDLRKIPYYKSEIERLTEEAVKLRTDTRGEVANQQVHMPICLPKVPGRFYYYFGKPIETEGRKQELRDRKKAYELYLQVKSEVENCLAYLKDKRENDPYRNLVPRLIFQATHGFTSEVPTFEI